MRLKLLSAFALLLASYPAYVVAANPYWIEESRSIDVSPSGIERTALRIEPKDTKAKVWVAHWTQKDASGVWNEEARQLIVKYR